MTHDTGDTTLCQSKALKQARENKTQGMGVSPL